MAEIINVLELTALASGTLNVPVESNLSLGSFNGSEVRIIGTVTLSGNLNISPTGTPKKNTIVIIDNEAAITAAAGVGDYIIFGQTIPYTVALKNFRAVCIYNGSTWVVYILVDRSDKIPFNELATLSSANILIGNSSGVPTSVSVSGDVTISNTGVVTIGNSKVMNVMIDTMDAAKLTGTVAVARIADKSLPSDKLSGMGLLDSKYSDTATTAVTSEETLYSYTVAGGTCSNDGEGLRIIASGSFAGNANTKIIKFKFGGNTYATNGVTTAPNGDDFRAVFEVMRSGATSAIGSGECIIEATSQGVALNKGGVTWATDNDVVITGQNGTAAANDIVLSLVTIEQIR